MAEINLEKIYASFLLRLEEVTEISQLSDIEKEYLGKGSVLSEERSKLSSLSNEDKKKYGAALKKFSEDVQSKLTGFKKDFQKSFYIKKESKENPDLTINWHSKEGTKKHILTNVMAGVLDGAHEIDSQLVGSSAPDWAKVNYFGAQGIEEPTRFFQVDIVGAH